MDPGSLTPLLYCRPPGGISPEPVEDELTEAARRAWARAEVVATWRGFHLCACGERSTNSDYRVPGGFVTNSLCVHYLAWHRDSVPPAELVKVRRLVELELEPVEAVRAARFPVGARVLGADEVGRRRLRARRVADQPPPC